MTITFVGAGAATTGNNASVAPALHASTAAGDLVIVHASIRGTSATVTTPAGWTLIGGTANVAIFGKIAAASEPAPTIAFVGGSAGDDTIAQAATWRGMEPYAGSVAFNIQTNGSAQNVAYPALTVPADNHLVIVGGWKQDDSTGWAAIAGFTEIGESNPTAGNDASMAWDYQIQTTATNLSSGSFTITGGAAAVSKGFTLLVRPAAAIAVQSQDSWPARALVSVTGLTLTDDVAVYRVVAGARTLLRAGTAADVTDPAFLVIDAELPFGVPVSYVAVVNSFAEYATGATTYTLTGGKVAVTDAISGASAEVVVLTWPEKGYENNATLYRIAAGRNIVVAGVFGQFTATYELFCATTSSVETLRDLLTSATSSTIQIRQPGGYDGVDSYGSVISYRERRWSQDGSDDRRVFVLEVAQVSGWASSLEAQGFTLQDVYDFYGASGTLADLNADFPGGTLLDVAQADWSP